MLVGLSIRCFVIVSRLNAEFGPGFCALTGETGVGKSVIILALQSALGGKIDPSVIATGADSATVSASFDLDQPDHPVFVHLTEMGIEAECPITLRRVIRRQGGSRSFINDQAVSVATLRSTGSLLVEVQSQRASHKLLRPDGQTELLDSFAEADANRADCQALWTAWQSECAALDVLRQRHETLREDRSYCRDALDELEVLDAAPGEAAQLGADRRALQQSAQIGQTLQTVDALLMGRDDGPSAHSGALSALAEASANLARLGNDFGDLREAHQAIERALAETDEAARSLRATRERLDQAPERLDAIEERLFAITAAARKHNTDPDQLQAVRARLGAELATAQTATDELNAGQQRATDAKAQFDAAVQALSDKRATGARALAEAVMCELPPMRLQAVRFRVRLTERAHAGPSGAETVMFEVATNRGMAFGPLGKIASGGEFSRMALALRLCVRRDTVGTLIFDEADAGIGGATAAAVGARLARLAEDRQVMAVTHSPQVAAASSAQWRIYKEERDGRTEAGMTLLGADSRTEEIARMISGAQVTTQARAAAERLLAGL